MAGKIRVKSVHNRFKKTRLLSGIAGTAVVFCLFLAFFFPLNVWTACAADDPEPEELSMSDGFDPVSSIPAVYVKERLHNVDLYARSSEKMLEIPGVIRLMMLYMAAERLPADTLLSINKDAAALSEREAGTDRIVFRSGDQYPLRFLLLYMLFHNSDAAAVAIVSNLSTSRQTFIHEMQQTAQLLGMNNTFFQAVEVSEADNPPGGTPVPTDPGDPQSNPRHHGDPLNRSGEGLPEAGADTKTARTTLRDVAKLAAAIAGSPKADALFRETSTLITITTGGRKHIAALRSPAAGLVTLSENRVEAAAAFPSVSQCSLSVNYGKTVNGIPVMVIAAEHAESISDRSLLKLYQDIDGFYELTLLARKGDRYPGVSEKAVNGAVFNVVYLENTSYVHPKNNPFLEPALDYYGNAPYPLPVVRGDQTGQVTFTLRNGLRIQVPVGSDRDIQVATGLIGRTIARMEQNPNLAQVILVTGAVLCLLLALYAFRKFLSILHWIRLNSLENIAESAHNLIPGSHGDGESSGYGQRGDIHILR